MPLRTPIIVVVATFALTAVAHDASAQVDRYGGVWHQGEATGPFVPPEVGMSFADLQSYRQAWPQYRITDLEVVSGGCPSSREDLFASQWEKGKWTDSLVSYADFSAFEGGLVSSCRRGMVLVDFEIWDSSCRGEETRYVALYREGKCSTKSPPVVASDWPWSYKGTVDSMKQSGYALVDYEVGSWFGLPETTGVFYPGNVDQDFMVLSRPDFEQEMLTREGVSRLEDMESFKHNLYKQSDRYVVGLWNNDVAAADDEHEVGEVYSKFSQLLFKEADSRRLADFEIHENTLDLRFIDTFKSYLEQTSVGYSFSVMQAGEEVSFGAGGYAVRADPANGVSPIVMTPDSIGVTASVTKMITALGVIRYADTIVNEDWLETPVVSLLPGDFGDFGAGVADVTLRQLLTQQTGLATFDGTDLDPINAPTVFRQAMVDWLKQPRNTPAPPPGQNYPAEYQNAHFDLLAIVMEESVLPPIVLTSTPWRDWINTEVLANANVGARFCGGTSVDALSYPYAAYPNGIEWMSSSYPCAGDKTGAAMFWLSSRDLAKVGDALRDGSLVSSPRMIELFDIGMGLDKPDGTMTYTPWNDGNSATRGDVIHFKNGGIGGWVNSELAGSETLLAFYDDENFDDDCVCNGNACLCLTPDDGPENDEYDYELGYRDFSIGIMIHSTPVASDDPCLPEDMTCALTRLFPSPLALLREAVQLPENW